MWHVYGRDVDREALQNDPDCRRKAVGFALVAVALVCIPDVVLWMLPGLTVALVGFVMVSTRRRNESAASTWGWLALLLLLASCVSPWLHRARYGGGAKLHPVPNAAERLLEVAGREPLKVPSSGEEVMLNNGTFIRVADANKPDGSAVFEGWQSRLIMRLTSAIRKRQQQVVLVFTHQDCPGCAHLCRMQLIVLRHAIALRSVSLPYFSSIDDENEDVKPPPAPLPLIEVMGEAPDSTPGLAFLGSDWLARRFVAPVPSDETHHQKPSLLQMPLRIFVLDAAEFIHLAGRAASPRSGKGRGTPFPVTIAWRPEPSGPLMARGYLDGETFSIFLKQAAMTDEGDDEEEFSGKGRWRFRLTDR